MTGQVSPSLTPCEMCTTGRRARWSMSDSPSKVATSSVGIRRQQRGDGAVGAEPGVDPSVEGHDQHGIGRGLRSTCRS